MAVLGYGLPTNAQTVDTTDSTQLIQSFGTEASFNQKSLEGDQFYPNIFTPTQVEYNVSEQNPAQATNLNQLQLQNSEKEDSAESVVTPVPGTIATTSAALVAPQNSEVNEGHTEAQVQSAPRVAQADIDPGRRTRGGSSYVGIAGNIGLGGDSSLGDGNFMVISKIGLTNAISVRPAAVFGDNTTILIPVTYDFSFRRLTDPFSEPLPIAPYVGLGAAIETGDDTDVSLLLSGGIDVPITTQFTATAAVNAAFANETDVGLSIGVGYNFSGLFGL